MFSKRADETSWALKHALICAMRIMGIFTALWDLGGSIDFMAFKIKSGQKAHYQDIYMGHLIRHQLLHVKQKGTCPASALDRN